ncbi:hypothetical protein LZ480_15720 [Solibacillus sp. MA9]|uniref:Uncharacterized protein n=1 Tax=Solibacillus palustris TaxID=2908203 RepID=A0ABS9UG55_9BACL|nr:hypothetical protein [Solibacillus sp. MA9]MCH7323324.1 hypothetical protein [Solibacillus sp. MA9]
MTKNTRLMKLSVILSIVGIVLIMCSGWVGRSFSNLWLQSIGGSIDTEIFLYMLNSFRNSTLLIGGILFTVCLPTAIFAWYQTLDKAE